MKNVGISLFPSTLECPLQETCESQCKHSKCSKQCGEKCDREPCQEKCDKNLDCGHSCIGYCGEPCPPKCRICDVDEVMEGLCGFRDYPEAR